MRLDPPKNPNHMKCTTLGYLSLMYKKKPAPFPCAVILFKQTIHIY